MRIPLIRGPNAVANTINDIATDLTEPKCLVPKNSGQNAPETVAPSPCINPRKAKHTPAPISVVV